MRFEFSALRMKPLGIRKIRARVAGHQNCRICHSESKLGRAREKEDDRREVDQQLEPENGSVLEMQDGRRII